MSKAVEEDPSELRYVPDLFKSQEMCDKAVRIEPLLLIYIPDHLKTKEMCKKAIEKGLWGAVLCP